MDNTLPTDSWAGRQYFTKPSRLTKGERIALWVIGFVVSAGVVAFALGQL